MASLAKRAGLLSRVMNIPGRLTRLTAQELDVAMRRVRAAVGACYRVRALGLGTLSMAYLAQGHFDIYADLTGVQNLVDAGVGMIIAQEAGARASGLDGSYHGRDVRF